MTDIIKKAVELADSWEMVGDVICFSVAAGDRKRSACSIHNTHTVYLDALAAQLVRQVDVSHYLVCYEHETVIQSIGEDGLLDDPCNPVGRATGQARTMNTIKAIVDSGVLE